MSDHDNDTCPHLVRASLLEAENVRLKAEVERLHKYVETMERESMSDEYDINHQTRIINGLLADKERLQAEVERLKEGNDCLGQMHDKEMERSAYLLEEFNRTTAWGRGLESDLSHARVEISSLKAEVERLTERNKFLEQIDSYLQGANENAYEKRCDELEAEVERLESDNLKLKDDLERQIETRNYFIHKMMLKIKHVDLLTSSGDNLQNALLKLTSGTPDWNQEIFWNWNAAKEGKPSV